MRSISTEGIIIKKRNRGEHDYFVTIYCPSLGKIDAVAKGARKIDSAFSGHLETLNICQFQLHKSAHSYTITQCQAKQTFGLLRDNLEKSLLALLIMEIFQKSTYIQEHGHGLFDLLNNSLAELSKSKKHAIVIEAFKIKLLQILGAMPDISLCSICRTRFNEDVEILLDNDGHLYCNNCRTPNKDYQVIEFNIIKLVNFICTQNFDRINKISLQKTEESKLRNICNIFLQHYIDREILSENIIAWMANKAARGL